MRMGTNSFVSVVVLVVATLSVSVVVNGATINRKFSAQQVMNSIPPEERGHFITLQLAKAERLLHHNFTIYNDIEHDYSRGLFVYSDVEEDKFKNIDVPEDFCINLLNWVENSMEKFNQYSDHRGPGNGTVCNPKGCVNPGDVGSLCCPF